MDIRDVDIISSKDEYLFLRYLRSLLFSRKAKEYDVIDIENISDYFDLFYDLLNQNKYGYYTFFTGFKLQKIQKELLQKHQRKARKMNDIFNSQITNERDFYRDIFNRRYSEIKFSGNDNLNNYLNCLSGYQNRPKNKDHRENLSFDYALLATLMEFSGLDNPNKFSWLTDANAANVSLFSLMLIMREYPSLMKLESVQEMLNYIINLSITPFEEQLLQVKSLATSIQKKIQFL